VLEVETTMKTFRITNALRGAAKELESAMKPGVAKGARETTWYAPGVGPVQVLLDGLKTVALKCSG
jgi:hypothetical protein